MHNNIDRFHFSFWEQFSVNLKNVACQTLSQKYAYCSKYHSSYMMLHLFSPLNFQWNSQVLNESLPNRTRKVTPPPVHSPPKPLAQQSEVPTPSILSAPYQLCQAFNLPGDIPVFPAWDRGRDKHAPLCGKSLCTPPRSLI